MIHLVCDCGSLVSIAPPAGTRAVECRSCRRVLDVPDPAALGVEFTPAPVPAPIPANDPPVPAPVPAAAPPAASAPPRPVPSFDTDDRLNLRSLEREVARLALMGRLVAAAGLIGAGAALALPGRGPAERVLLAGAALFAALAGWSGLRAARSACLASIVLAQRQREILRGMARGA